MVDCDCVSVDSTLATAAAWIGIVTFITTSIGIISGALIFFNHVRIADDELIQFANSLLMGDKVLKIGMGIVRRDSEPVQNPNQPYENIQQDVRIARERLSNDFGVTQEELEAAIQANVGNRLLTPLQWARTRKKWDKMRKKLRDSIPHLLILQMALLYLSVIPYSSNLDPSED